MMPTLDQLKYGVFARTVKALTLKEPGSSDTVGAIFNACVFHACVSRLLEDILG